MFVSPKKWMQSFRLASGSSWLFKLSCTLQVYEIKTNWIKIRDVNLYNLYDKVYESVSTNLNFVKAYCKDAGEK